MAALAAMLMVFPWAAKAVASDPAHRSSDARQPPDPAVRQSLEAFLRAAENLYQAAVQGDLMNIQQYVNETDRRLRELPMQQIASAEGVEALARSVTRMKRAVAAISGPERDWQTPAAEIRLAADALAHPDKPLWHMYRDIVMDDIKRIEQAVGNGGQMAAARAALQDLQGHYGLIRTAALLHAEPSVVERTDSVLRYAQRVLEAQQPRPDLLQSVAPALREAFAALFPAANPADTAAMVPAPAPGWGWPALMASFIVTVLTWAGWLRYKQWYPVTPRGNLPPEHREHRRSR